MTIRLVDRGIRVVLLDIEGTTTPMSFVHETLFTYAQEHLDDWLDTAGAAERTAVIGALKREYAGDLSRGEPVPVWSADETAATIAYARYLMAADRKSTALKELQGLIWERGYAAGELRGVVFADVPDALDRWHRQGIQIAIYSSGSALAQRRLFESPASGDLSKKVSGYFDTTAGPKTSPDSYARIAATLSRAPREILFVSDAARELRAAEAAGCVAVLSERPGNPPQPDAGSFESVRSFDEIV